ncbi:MAG: hypothetical protein VCD00_18225, partial [Candidatus Hydrogenedentota bacterium]
ARHHLASVRTESKLKMGVVGSAAVLLWYGILSTFSWAFHWLQRSAFDDVVNVGDTVTLAEVLMARLLSVFALALFFMLIFSNTLIAFSTLYKAKEVQYLLQAPLAIRNLFLARFIECVSFSSWGSAYLGSPLILAYGMATDAHWLYYFAALAFYLPFVMIPAAIGCIITLILVRIFPKLPRFALVALAAFAVIALFMNLRAVFNAESLAQDTIVSSVLTATTQTQSPLLPSYWASQGVLSASQNDFRATGYFFLLLLSNALMITFVAAEVAHHLFRPGFSALLGSEFTKPKPLGKGILGRLDSIFKPLRQPYRALVIKDIKLFWRDPTQWTQFVIFFGIMAIYVANIGGSSIDHQSERYRSWIASLNSGSCTLILASLTSRFVYPLISLEGFRFWILGLAPMTKEQLLRQKYWLSILTTTPFTLGLTIVSCYFLRVTPVHFAVSIYSILLANFTLAGLAVGLGTIYPNFQEDNPARIVSGMGGTLNFLLSIAYITLLIGSQMFILMWYAQREHFQPELFWYALTGLLLFNTALSLFVGIVPMRLGLRNLLKTEF